MSPYSHTASYCTSVVLAPPAPRVRVRDRRSSVCHGVPSCMSQTQKFNPFCSYDGQKRRGDGFLQQHGPGKILE